jgi:hypothetical protein
MIEREKTQSGMSNSRHLKLDPYVYYLDVLALKLSRLSWTQYIVLKILIKIFLKSCDYLKRACEIYIAKQ